MAKNDGPWKRLVIRIVHAPDPRRVAGGRPACWQDKGLVEQNADLTGVDSLNASLPDGRDRICDSLRAGQRRRRYARIVGRTGGYPPLSQIAVEVFPAPTMSFAIVKGAS